MKKLGKVKNSTSNNARRTDESAAGAKGKKKLVQKKGRPVDAEQPSNAEYEHMLTQVLENADEYGVSQKEEAEVIARLLLLEKQGRAVRTGEKRLTSHGLMQDVFVVAPKH